MSVNSKDYFELNDEKLVALAQQANKDSIKELYRRYKNRMLSYCNHFLYSKDEAEDVTQEIFIKTFNSINNFRQDSSFATWIYKIAKNTCLNKNGSLAVRMRNLFVSADKPIEQGTNLYDMLKNNIDAPRNILELEEIKILLNKAIDELPDKKRRVIYLRCIEDFAYNEIADITGLKLGTVKILIRRGREDLRVKLKNVIRLRNSN